MATKKENRIFNLIPHGVPSYLRIYDNGGTTLDRYTIVFTGRLKTHPKHTYFYRSSSETGAGVYMWGETQNLPVDKPKYSQLGKKITFNDLAPELQQRIIEDYKEIWEIEKEV